MSGLLPPGWANTDLGAVAETRLGKMLSKKAKVGTEPRPYLRNKSVQWGRIDLDDLKYWSAEFQEAYRGPEEATASFLRHRGAAFR